MLQGLPFASKGQRIGLLGGSFDPPHAGHVHISRWALKRFQLDQLWWLVSPGNPLKSKGPAPLPIRMAACMSMVTHPRIIVTDLESRLGTRYSAQTLDRVTALYRRQRFVWLMGADNLVTFHKWDRWQQIMQRVPIGVLARPGEQLAAGRSKAAQRYRRYRLSPMRAEALPFCSAPSWTLLNGPMMDISSTAIRNTGAWG